MEPARRGAHAPMGICWRGRTARRPVRVPQSPRRGSPETGDVLRHPAQVPGSRAQAHRPLRPRRPRGRVRGAGPRGPVVPPAVPSGGRPARPPLLRGEPPLGALRLLRGAAGPADRPAHHHGPHPPAVQPPPGPRPADAHVASRRRCAARPPRALADGRPNPPGLHHGLVPPEERAAAAGLTTAVRPAAASLTPLLAGVALQTAGSGIPFFLAGGLKALYDVILWVVFRHVPLADREPSGPAAPRRPPGGSDSRRRAAPLS